MSYLTEREYIEKFRREGMGIGSAKRAAKLEVIEDRVIESPSAQNPHAELVDCVLHIVRWLKQDGLN